MRSLRPCGDSSANLHTAVHTRAGRPPDPERRGGLALPLPTRTHSSLQWGRARAALPSKARPRQGSRAGLGQPSHRRLVSRWGCCPLHSALPGLHCLVCLRHPHLLRYVTRRCDVHTSFLPHSPPLSSPTVFFLHCLTANRTMLRKSRGPLLLIMVSLEPETVPAMVKAPCCQ